MIRVKIIKNGKDAVGFETSGHSGYADSGSDIVCAAVSSAVGLCETIINDSFAAGSDVSVDPSSARVSLMLSKEGKSRGECRKVISSFERHMKALAEEYPKYIQVLEVQSNA